MLNIASLNKIKQQNLNSKLKNNEKINNAPLINNNPTSRLNNFEVGQSIKSSLLISFSGNYLKHLNWDGTEERVSTKKEPEVEQNDTSKVVAAKRKPTLNWDGTEERVSSKKEVEQNNTSKDVAAKRKPTLSWDESEESVSSEKEAEQNNTSKDVAAKRKPTLSWDESEESVSSEKEAEQNNTSKNVAAKRKPTLSWDESEESVSSEKEAEQNNTSKNVVAKKKPTLSWDSSEENSEELSWSDETETISSYDRTKSAKKNKPNNDNSDLTKEEQKELKKQKARNAYLDRQIAREKRQAFFNALKVGLLGSILTAGGIVASPYIPVIQKKAGQLSDTLEMVSNPQCIAPSISSGKLLKPTPPEFLKVEGDTTPDPYSLKTTDVCLSQESIDKLQLKQQLIKSKDQYLQLSENEMKTFEELKAHSPSYMEIDHQGNKESFIAFLPKEVRMSDGRVLPEGTIFFETFINRGVNNSKKVELIAYIDPKTGFINNVEKDLTKNMPKEFQPESLEGLKETNNAAKQLNERVKNLIAKYKNKDNPDISDTLIPEPHNNSFFKVRSYDLMVLDQTLLNSNKSTIIYKNTDGTVNMVFAAAPPKDTSIKAKVSDTVNNLDAFHTMFAGFTDKIKYSFVFFENGTVLPDNADFNNAEKQKEFSEKAKSFIFVTDDGTIGIISKDGILIPPLNTLDYNKDSFAEMIAIKEQIHSMRQDLFAEGKLDQFSELIQGSNNITAITDLNYVSLPNALHPNEVTALHATFIGNNTIALNGANNKEILSLQKRRDFDTKTISYEFSVNPLGDKVLTGTINENGQIGFNSPDTTQFETDIVKRRVKMMIDAGRNNPQKLVVTKTPKPMAQTP